MAKAEDLKIKIPLTPTQEELFPEIVKKLNSDLSVLMDRIVLKDRSIEANCFDLSEVLEAISEHGSELEYCRFKKQALNVLEISFQNTLNLHLQKNYKAAIAAFR